MMAQSVSVDYQRTQSAYWNAELALATSLHDAGKVSDLFLSQRIRAATNVQHKKPPFDHHFTGQKVYRHD